VPQAYRDESAAAELTRAVVDLFWGIVSCVI
jgi:hypothetical protein